jgi:hypothetical protein
MDSNDRKFGDDPQLTMLAVANSLLNTRLDAEAIECLPESIIQEFGAGTKQVWMSPKQARYIRMTLVKWLKGVSSGKFNDVSLPMAVHDPDFLREVLQPLAFFNEPGRIPKK